MNGIVDKENSSRPREEAGMGHDEGQAQCKSAARRRRCEKRLIGVPTVPPLRGRQNVG
jgi:hypothetical protein